MTVFQFSISFLTLKNGEHMFRGVHVQLCIFTVDISFIYRSLKVLEFGLILYEILAKKGLIAAQTFGYKGLISV